MKGWCIIGAIAVIAAVCNGDSSVPVRSIIVSTSKARALRMDLNKQFPEWCNRNPHSRALDGHPGCTIILREDPHKGDLFATSTAGNEIHAQEEDYLPYTEDNQWMYVEDTYTEGSSDDSDGDGDGYAGSKTTFQSGEAFDRFPVDIFSPKEAANRSATANITVRVINHLPVALSSTLVLRWEDPWSVDASKSNKSKTFCFPRALFLQAVDADVSQTNRFELRAVTNISGGWYPSKKSTSLVENPPRFVDIRMHPVVNTTEEDDTYYDPDSVFLAIEPASMDRAARSLFIQYDAVDDEGATSTTKGMTHVTIAPQGNSLLPEAPIHAMQDPRDFIVQRLFGVPSVVLCAFMQGGATYSDCNFVLLGGDLLSTQVSMSAIAPSTEADRPDISPNGMLEVESILSDAVETEGNFRISKYANISADDYYPTSPIGSRTAMPLFGAKFVLSDITADSPPDAISTAWRVNVKEFPLPPSDAPAASYESLPIPLRIYSQYVPAPKLRCDSVSFVWSKRTLVVPSNCGDTNQYDQECNRYLTDGNQVQTMAVLSPGFQISFDTQEDLDGYSWLKDSDAVYLVSSVESVAQNTSDGGCVFHSLLLRELVVGDVIHSEADLTWMPHVSGPAPYRWQGAEGDYHLCSRQHKRIQLAVIVGEDVVCSFTVSAPITDSPPLAEKLIKAYHTVVPFSSSLVSAERDSVSSSVAGSVVIPFGLHEVVSAVCRDENPSPTGQPSSLATLTRAVKWVPNIVSQSLMMGYANGVITYPQKPLKSSQVIYVPSDPFPSLEPPKEIQDAYEGIEDFHWAVHLRRFLTAVVTSTSSAAVYPSRRVAFTAKQLASAQVGERVPPDVLLHVDLRRDNKESLFVSRSSRECNVDVGRPTKFSGTHPLLLSLQQNLFTAFEGRSGSSYADADIFAAAPSWRVDETYEVFLDSGTTETIYFEMELISAWLVVTRHPKFASVVSHYDSDKLAPWWTRAVQKAANASKVPIRPTETSFAEQCAALALQVDAPDDALQSAAGEVVGYADDVLRVAVSDGRSVSPEIAILLRIRKPIASRNGANDGFGQDGSVKTMDVPILVMCAVVFVSVLLYYRRKIRRWIHRWEAASDSSEDIEEQRRVSESRAASILKTIRAMVATKSSAAFSRLSSGGRVQRSGAALSDNEDDGVALQPSSIAVSAEPHTASNDNEDDWDEWETGGCAPHSGIGTTNTVAPEKPAAPQIRKPTKKD